MSKSKWKKQVKEKIRKSIEERTRQEMANKAKARIIVEDKWEKKKYLQEYDSDTMKDVIKIRLHMWQVNCNYKTHNTDTECPFCQKSEDTTKHVLECEKAKKFTLSKENSKEEQEETTEIYKKNKKNRELAVIKVQDYKIGRKYRKEEQKDKNHISNNNNNNKTHTQVGKRIKRRVRGIEQKTGKE